MIGPEQVSKVLPLLFPFFYAIGLWFIGTISGWRSLAKRYPADRDPGPRLGRLLWGSLQTGIFSRYNHCIVWSPHEQGLRLAPWFFLRIGHPPILLPWEGLRFVQRAHLWILDGIDVITPDGTRLWIPLLQAKRLRKLSHGRFWPIKKASS